MTRNNTQRLGFTLVEVMVSMAVLAIGTTGVLGLITMIGEANAQRTFQTESNTAFGAFSAQVAAATCDWSIPALAPQIDVGLGVPPPPAYTNANGGVPGSVITLVGRINDLGAFNVQVKRPSATTR